jgi:hypothetical protein
MHSVITRFRMRRDSWDGYAEIDLSEDNCCVLTGGNGEGKTLMMKLLSLVGKWYNHPNKYNTIQIEDLALKSDVSSIEVEIKSEIINGHGPYCATANWIKKWSFDPMIVYGSENDFVNPMLLNSDIKSTNEFLIDVHCINKIHFEFKKGQEHQSDELVKINRSIGVNYLIRDYEDMNEDDQMLRDSWNLGSELPFTPIFDPLKFDQINRYDREVIEYAEQHESENFHSLGYNKYSNVNSNLDIDREFDNSGLTVLEILAGFGIIIEVEESLVGTIGLDKSQISQPIILKVDRNLLDTITDMEQIRLTDQRLSNPENCKKILESGWKSYKETNRTISPPSLFVQLMNETVMSNDFEITDHIDDGGLESLYISINEPFFPSLWAFKKFLGKVPEGSYLSSGQLQLLSMTKAVISSDYNSLIMIDEPELSLHIDWQRKLIHFMSIAFPKHRFIFATHSPDILYNQYNNVIQIPPLEQ